MPKYDLGGDPVYKRYRTLTPIAKKRDQGEAEYAPEEYESRRRRTSTSKFPPIGAQGLRTLYKCVLCSYKKGGISSRMNNYFVVKEDDDRTHLDDVHVFWENAPDFIKMGAERLPNRKVIIHIQQEEMDGTLTDLDPTPPLPY